MRIGQVARAGGDWNTEIYMPAGESLDVNISWEPSVTGDDNRWRDPIDAYMVQEPGMWKSQARYGPGQAKR